MLRGRGGEGARKGMNCTELGGGMMRLRKRTREKKEWGALGLQ